MSKKKKFKKINVVGVARKIPSAPPSDKVLYISYDAMTDLAAWMFFAGGDEVGGLGIVEPTEDGNFVVPKLWLGTSLSSGIHLQTVSQQTLIMEQAYNMGYKVSQLRLYWHTHPNSPNPQFSVVDDDAIIKQVANGQEVINLLIGEDLYNTTARVDQKLGDVHTAYAPYVIWRMSNVRLEQYRQITEAREAARAIFKELQSTKGKP